jgi:hypothetical protein
MIRTLAEATKATCPKTDGISFLPTLTGKGGEQAQYTPIRPGEIYNRKLIDKDRRQAPHRRRLQQQKPKAAAK